MRYLSLEMEKMKLRFNGKEIEDNDNGEMGKMALDIRSKFVKSYFRLLRFQYAAWFELLEPVFRDIYFDMIKRFPDLIDVNSLRWFIQLLYKAAIKNKEEK